jgi:hypothetical protein
MKKLILALLLILAAVGNAYAAQLVPNGKQCFTKTNGAPATSGSINMFVPNTTAPKATWLDSGQTMLNTQPIQLDGNGCAVIYGTGIYRQQLFDGPVMAGLTTGILIWDQLVADPSSFGALAWGGIAGGTPNAITVNFPGFSAVDGSPLQFQLNATNTGAATITVGSLTNIAVTKPGPSGPIPVVAGDLTAGNVLQVVYVAASNTFAITGPTPVGGAAAVSVITSPQGYLTLSNDPNNPVQSTDVSAAATIYYTPYTGNIIPIWNGTTFTNFTFNQLQLALSASQVANTIYDACVFSNAGVPTIVATPAWTNSTAGASARGTGAGTPQIARISGIWVTSNQITGLNGAGSFTIPVNQCTYVGSFYTDATAGQVSAHVNYGQNRKFGVWNAYNRQTLQVKEGDATASWSYNTATIRAANNVPATYAQATFNQGSGTAANGITVLSGLPEEPYSFTFIQRIEISVGGMTVTTAEQQIGVGLNSITAFTGTVGDFQAAAGVTGGATVASVDLKNMVTATWTSPPLIGVNVVTAAETAVVPLNGTKTQFGTETNMLLLARWRG